MNFIPECCMVTWMRCICDVANRSQMYRQATSQCDPVGTWMRLYIKVAVEHNCDMISMSLGDTFATYLRHRKYIAFRSPCNIQEWNSFLTWLVVTTNSKQISRLIDPTSVTSFVYIDRLCRFNGAIANEVYLMHEHCWIFVKQILGLQPNSTTWFNIIVYQTSGFL